MPVVGGAEGVVASDQPILLDGGGTPKCKLMDLGRSSRTCCLAEGLAGMLRQEAQHFKGRGCHWQRLPVVCIGKQAGLHVC